MNALIRSFFLLVAGLLTLSAAERPNIVLTSITGFGQTGPHRDWASTDLVAGAVGGSLYVTGEAEDPPVSLAGQQNHLMASTTAAASSLMALRHAGRFPLSWGLACLRFTARQTTVLR